jgi:hypothetical protein
MARYVLGAILRWDEVDQQTFAARMGPFQVTEIEAARRILKDRSRLPGSLDRTTVATLLQEFEF